MKKILRAGLNLLLLCVTLAVMLLLLEVFVRLTGLQPFEVVPKIYRVSDVPGLVYELVPSIKERGFNKETVTTNSLGLRSPETDANKPKIVVLGDSMAFSFGVEDDETNSAVMQKALPDYQIVNMGVSGYNMEQEARQYMALAQNFDPKLVILEFVINDAGPKAHYNSEGKLTTEELTPQEEKARLESEINGPGKWRIPGKVFLEQQSALFRFVERRTKGMWFRAKNSDLGTEWTPEELAYYSEWFAKLDTAIGNRPKLLVRWPDNWLHPATLSKVDRMAENLGWRVLDLGDLFGIRYPTLGWDQHPNAETQKRAGEMIAEYIKREGLVR